MQQTFVCPSCGRQNPGGQQFCGSCGGRLFGGQQQAYGPQQMYSCVTCGQPVAYGARFCGHCRTLLNWSAQGQMQSPPAYPNQQQTPYYAYAQDRTTQQVRKSAGAMQILSLIWGILAIIGLFVAVLPFLGWMNWFNIPFSFIGLIISIVGTVTAKGGRGIAIAGIILCCLAVFVGSIRLILGAGLL